MSGEAEIPDGLAAYEKALQSNRKIAEPISDEELQEVRGYVERTIRSQELHNLLLKGPCAAGLLARLDAAESRAAELQREVDRLRIHKSQEISKPDDVVWRFTCHECGHHKHVVAENFSHCPSCGSKVRYWDNGSLQ